MLPGGVQNARRGKVLEYCVGHFRHKALRRMLHETERLQSVPLLRKKSHPFGDGIFLRWVWLHEVRFDGHTRLVARQDDARLV